VLAHRCSASVYQLLPAVFAAIHVIGFAMQAFTADEVVFLAKDAVKFY